MDERYIIWEKWVDPFGGDSEHNEWPGAYGNFQTDKIIQAAIQNEEIDEEEFEKEDVDKAIQEHQRQQLHDSKKIMVVPTPMGFIPISEHSRAGNLFNFWVGHTSFRITNTTVDIIDDCAGVESLDIFTSYRFRISIGKIFDSQHVKRTIMDALQAKSPPLIKKE